MSLCYAEHGWYGATIPDDTMSGVLLVWCIWYDVIRKRIQCYIPYTVPPNYNIRCMVSAPKNVLLTCGKWSSSKHFKIRHEAKETHAWKCLYCTLWLCTSAVTSRKYTTNQFPFWAWPSLSLSQWQRTFKAPTSRLLPGFQTWAKHGFHVDSSHIFFSFNPSEGIPFRNCYISNISSLVCNMCKHPGSCRVPAAPVVTCTF